MRYGLQIFSSFNKAFKYILTVIDVFSKYALAIPIKDKTAASVTKAFEKIISNRISKTLWVDKGKEFYNTTFKILLDKHKIGTYSTFNEGKAVVIERFNRTLKISCGNILLQITPDPINQQYIYRLKLKKDIW